MKNVILFIACLLCGMCAAAVAQAEDRPLPIVPDTIAEPQRSEFEAQRSDIQRRIGELNARIEQFNQECKSVKKGSPEARQCFYKDNEIYRDEQALLKEKDKFTKSLADARKTAGAAVFKGALGTVVGHGEFYIETAEGKKITGKEALNIPLGSKVKIVTGATGNVTISLGGGDRIVLHPGTQFEFAPGAGEDKRKSYGELFRGVVYMIENASKRRFAHIRTPTAVAAVRGTEFEVSAREDKSGYIKLFSGALEITPKTGKKFSMKKGQMVRFASDGAVTGPMPLEAGDKPKE